MINSKVHWSNTPVGKPYSFLVYYVPKRLDEYVSDESLFYQKRIWNFKDGINQQFFLDEVKKVFAQEFEHPEEMTLVCIPASSNYSNNRRYGWFSESLCASLGMHNGFEHIEIVREKEPKHCGGSDSGEYEIDASFFNGKKVILFDDVVTRGTSMREFAKFLEQAGASVECCFSIGRTCSERDFTSVVHPLSMKNVSTGHSIEFQNDELTSTCNFDPEFESKNKLETHENVVTKNDEISCVYEEQITEKIQKWKKGDGFVFGKFEGKPIEWIVLKQEGDELLLISKYGLTCRPYRNEKKLSTWEDSDARKWLNGEFYTTCFNSNERRRLVKNLVRAEVNEYQELNPGNDTRDFVYILSISEYEKYFDAQLPWKCILLKRRIKRQCWLRNYGCDRAHAAFVGRSGSIHMGGSFVDSARNALRPVIRLKLSQA